MAEGQVEVAALLLLDFHADATLQNRNKKTPMELASPVTLEALRRDGVL
jgi:2,3-bisphosphoglycerate-independent phosphoglycerate mutase